ncbi:MAG: hypothetical protein K6G80_05775 [Treponema sp.]|nr:hypothetical protein [Treponema sp.]
MYSDDGLQKKRTITARNLDECRRLLFNMYGKDASILDYHTRLKGGFLGFGQRQVIEATYVVSDKSERLDSLRGDFPGTERGRLPSAYGSALPADSFQKNRDELLQKAGVNPVSAVQLVQMNKKIDSLTQLLEEKMEQISVATNADDAHPTIKRIEDLLAENEFTFSYISKITARIRNEFPLEKLDDFDAVQKAVVDWIGQSIHIAPVTHHRLPHVIVIVGPTGVGKTTTIAKMAACLILTAKNAGKTRPEIRLVTLDHTRVGAEEQLRRYGEMMNVPVDKAEYPDDVKKIFDAYKKSLDALIIDTSGYSPNDYENIAKLRALLDVDGLHPDVYLACMAGTKARDLTTILKNYAQFNYGSVIITKCDESSTYGNVISVLSDENKKISYITDGQQAAKNFERATVTRFLTRLNDFTIDRTHIDDVFPEE